MHRTARCAHRLGVQSAGHACDSSASQDIGAAIVSFDQATPPSSWRWAGPHWQPVDNDADRIIDATIATRDPSALAERWANVLGNGPSRPSNGACQLEIEDGTINFVPLREGADRIIEFGVRLRSGMSLSQPAVLCGTRFSART